MAKDVVHPKPSFGSRGKIAQHLGPNRVGMYSNYALQSPGRYYGGQEQSFDSSTNKSPF